MVLANDSILVTPGTGATIATHLVGAKEHEVLVGAEPSGHVHGTLDTYVAAYRLATEVAVSALSWSLGVGNVEKQAATIYHTAASTKTVRIRRVEFLIASTAACIFNAELRRLTAVAPATGNPAITPVPVDPASAAAEASCLALPGTEGSIVANRPIASQEINLGVAAAVSSIASFLTPIVLWPAEGVDYRLLPALLMRAGVDEGYAISCRASVAAEIKFTARIVFTEE